MKTIFPSACILALLTGCASQQADQSTAFEPDVFRSQVESPRTAWTTNEQEAMAARQLAWQRQQEPYDTGSYSSPSTGYPQSGSVSYTVPQQTPASLGPQRFSTPAPVGEHAGGPAPIATPVAGKPGYVLSPFAPQAGYVDVTGLAPGTEAKDPYTGKVFRVP